MNKDRDYYSNLFKSKIDDKYEKDTPGFILFDIAESLGELAEDIRNDLTEAEKKVDVDNLTGDELTKYVKQRRGIIRNTATNALVVLEITGTGDVKTGDLFGTDGDLLFESLEDKTITGTGEIKAQCITPGSVGVVPAGEINQIPKTIAGITAVTNKLASYDGFDDETDIALRNRYYEDLQNPITSNNIDHFQAWAKEVSGVGKVKVLPTWNGNNSVKLLILDSNFEPASQDLIDRVQEHIDPKDASKWGKGYGTSSLGAFCTVEAPVVFDLTIETSVKIDSNVTLDKVKENITNNLKEYLHELAFSETIDYISYSKIIENIMNSAGVEDSKDTKINNGVANVNIPINQIAEVKTLTVTEYV